MAQTASPSVLTRVGEGITRLRNFFLNAIFIIVLVAITVSLLSTCQGIAVPSNSALLINPKGVLVEQSTPIDRFADLFTAGGRQAEVEVGSIIRAIEHAVSDEKVRMIVLNLDELIWASPAHAQSIGHALQKFKDGGKSVVAYGRFFEQSQYHIASFADALYMHPMGQIILQGFGGFNFYFKELLERFDVTMHVFRVGEFKSAIEPVTRNDMSAESRMASEALYQDLWQQMLADISTNRRTNVSALQTYADDLARILETTQGDMARAALEHHLVDELLTADQAEVRISGEVGHSEDGAGTLNTIDFAHYLQANDLLNPAVSDSGNNIAVIVAQGTILTRGNGPGIASADVLVPLIRQAREDPNVHAVVLRVDSPGGDQFASEVIRQELELVQIAGKPVVASFGATAASGGYWISATADAIIAQPSSITGSIGIFSYVPSFEKTLAKYGVHTDGVGTTAITLGMSPFTGLSPAMSDILSARIKSGYSQFIDLVARGRNMAPEAVDEIAQGRVWSGAVAAEIGLVDELGSLQTALEKAAELAELDEWQAKPLRPAVDPRALLLEQLLGPAEANASAPSAAMQLQHSVERLLQLADPRINYAICHQCLSLGPMFRPL